MLKRVSGRSSRYREALNVLVKRRAWIDLVVLHIGKLAIFSKTVFGVEKLKRGEVEESIEEVDRLIG